MRFCDILSLAPSHNVKEWLIAYYWSQHSLKAESRARFSVKAYELYKNMNDDEHEMCFELRRMEDNRSKNKR